MCEQNRTVELTKEMLQRFLEKPDIQLKTEFDKSGRIKRVVFQRSVSDGESQEDLTMDSNSIILEEITKVEHVLGIPANNNGYKYLRDALMFSVQDTSLLNNIGKRLYPKIAEKYEVKATSVERAIRYEIEISWGRGDIEVVNEIFGYTDSSSKDRPTVGEYLAMLTDYIKIKLHI